MGGHSCVDLSKNNSFLLKIFDWLLQIKPEKNGIITKWNKLNIDCKSAFDSQALIEQKNEFCNQNLCLHCKIGRNLLKTNSLS